MDKLITEYWFLFVALVGVVVWLVRLEGRINQNEKDISNLQFENREEIKGMDSKLDSMNIKLTELCVSFAELSGYMKRFKEEDK